MRIRMEKKQCSRPGCNRTANHSSTLCFRCIAHKVEFVDHRCSFPNCTRRKGRKDLTYCFHHKKVMELQKRLREKRRMQTIGQFIGVVQKEKPDPLIHIETDERSSYNGGV